MGIRFSKSIKLGSLLKLNISKSGVSATVGKKGASINLGKNGTYLNLSPSIAGISGTGLSYRQKLAGGYGNVLNKLQKKETSSSLTKKTSETKKTKENETTNEKVDTSVIDAYNAELEATLNLYQDSPVVLTKQAFLEKYNETESESLKQIMKLSLDGDEDSIESLIGSIMSNLDLSYEAKANYELEEHDLYVDLDLPEIEDLKNTYPILNKNEIIYKEKTSTTLKEEYEKIVLSLPIYLSAHFFNQSPYIEQIIISAFTSKRDKNGDLKDYYLYSVKFQREIFETTDLTKIEDLYQFFLQFENRINLNTTNHTFKEITPYEMASETKSNKLIDDALAGLKELGYKVSDLNKIKEELEKQNFNNASEYLKYGLGLLRK